MLYVAPQEDDWTRLGPRIQGPDPGRWGAEAQGPVTVWCPPTLVWRAKSLGLACQGPTPTGTPFVVFGLLCTQCPFLRPSVYGWGGGLQRHPSGSDRDPRFAAHDVALLHLSTRCALP